MAIISVSLPDDLLARIDRAVALGGYSSRSEFIRKAVEDALASQAPGARYRLVIVQSDHERYPRVDQRIMEVAYRAAEDLVGLYHQVLEGGRCLTLILMREGAAAGSVTASLRRLRGVVQVDVVPIH